MWAGVLVLIQEIKKCQATGAMTAAVTMAFVCIDKEGRASRSIDGYYSAVVSSGIRELSLGDRVDMHVR
jgi:acyl-CoA thioesterase FadM